MAWRHAATKNGVPHVIVYLVRRLLQLVPVLVVASFAIFLVLHLVPGDAASMYAGQDATEEDIEALRRAMGLDEPVLVQYGRWLRLVFQGNLGTSLISGYSVVRLVSHALPASAELAIAALVFALLVGLPAGILAARFRGSVVDVAVSAYSSIALAIPNFWMGILLVLSFSVGLRWLPASGRVAFVEDPVGALVFLVLPVVTLGIKLSGVFARYTRSALLEVYGEEYVRTARAKGVHERAVLFKHVFRIALIPIVTVAGAELGNLIGGVVIVEAIFAWPGVGRLMLQSIVSRDFVVVQGTLLILITIFIFINLAVDIAYGLLNPRIRLS